MVRLVFRPYTRIRRSICTSEPLRASTMVSRGFALSEHRSPSFGSCATCSESVRPQLADRPWLPDTAMALSPHRKGANADPSLSLRLIAYEQLDDLQATQTPWSVFQDGSDWTPNEAMSGGLIWSVNPLVQYIVEATSTRVATTPIQSRRGVHGRL